MAITAEVLFINADYMKRYTHLNGSVEEDYLTPSIKLAQDKYVQSFLGTDLFDKLKADVVAGTVTGDYETLMDDYVREVTMWWAMVEYLPNSHTRVDNGGLVVRTSDDAQIPTQGEIRRLIAAARQNAQHYSKRLIDYLCNNSSSFPEYSTNTEGDMRPYSKAFNQSGFIVSHNQR